jgi:hypothetical protein
MSEAFTLFSVFLISIVASFFGSLIGGGTIISIPFLIMIGIPPQVAIATERFGELGQNITSFLKFLKSKKIIWKYVPVLTIFSLISSLIGSNILINTNAKILNNIVGITILAILPLLFLKKELGIKHINVSKPKLIFGTIIFFNTNICCFLWGRNWNFNQLHLNVLFWINSY